MGGSTTRKTERLVAWNTELLIQLLKHIVAKRNAVTGRTYSSVTLTAMAESIASGGMVVDEVVEIIELPDFDERLASKKVDPNTVVLSEEIVSQSRRFVSLIASMYRDNPFHNFEVRHGRLILASSSNSFTHRYSSIQHASHVTMSVSKLLSRIIAPQIDKEKLTTAKQHEELALHDHSKMIGLTGFGTLRTLFLIFFPLLLL